LLNISDSSIEFVDYLKYIGNFIASDMSDDRNKIRICLYAQIFLFVGFVNATFPLKLCCSTLIVCVCTISLCVRRVIA